MAETKVSARYAVSFLDLTSEKNNIDEVSKDMELILNAVRSSRDLRSILDSPVIKPEDKKSIIGEIFKNKINSDTLNFVKFIIDKDREGILVNIIEKFLEIRDEKLGIVRVEVKTSFDFTNNQRENLKKKLENILSKEAHINFIVDKKVIGGFIARVGDTVFDASVKHQLELLRREFLKNGIQLN